MRRGGRAYVEVGFKSDQVSSMCENDWDKGRGVGYEGGVEAMVGM